MLREAVIVFGVSTMLSASPGGLVPQCRQGELLISTGSAYVCRTVEAVLKEQRSSVGWGMEFLLPECPSGALLESEGFGRWKCVDREKVIPRCSSGETLISEGSSGWRCQRPGLPSCSSGETLISEGSSGWRCARAK